MKDTFHFESQEYHDAVQKQVMDKARHLTQREEIVVVIMILAKWEEGKKTTQRELALEAQWIGAHPTWEKKAIDAGFIETSQRRIREIIRTLRVLHGMPILSDSDGYYYPFTSNDGPTVLKRIESEVFQRNVSSVQTYKEMQKIFNTQSDFFDQVDALNQTMSKSFEQPSKTKKQQLDLKW